MNGYSLYCYYQSIKLHFTKANYNIFTHKGKTSHTYATYLKRRDYKLFEGAAKYFKDDIEVIQFIAANIAYGNVNCIYNLDESVDNYLMFLKRKQSITHTFKEDIDTIELEIDKTNESNLFEFSSSVPLVWKMYLAGQITPETINILNTINGFLDNVDSVVFNKDILRLKKFNGFFNIDIDKMITIYEKSLLNSFKTKLLNF
jgi:hypothetical protein